MGYGCGASFGNAGSGMDATMTTIPCVFRCGWFFTHIYIYIICIPLGQHSIFVPLAIGTGTATARSLEASA